MIVTKIVKGGFMKDTSPRAIKPRSEQVMVHTTSEVKERLQKIARERGWSLSKAGHLALEYWVRAMEAEGNSNASL